MSEVEEAAARKRRRRRRRKRAGNGPASTAVASPQLVAEADDDDKAPIEPSRVKAGTITIELPIRYMEILSWASQANRRTVKEQVITILRGVLTGIKPAYREAMTGSMGGSAPKGEATNRLLERKLPST